MESTPAVPIDLSSGQRNVLAALKRRGEASAAELAAALAITPNAVRQHLTTLRSAGLVASRREQGRSGRPAERYHSTHQGAASSAEVAEDLSVELLGYIEEADPELVLRLFERRRRRRVEQVHDQLAGKNLGEKVAALAVILDDEGYMADVDQLGEDRYRVTLCSCAIWEVASRHSEACVTEYEFLQEVLPEADIERVEHKVTGAYVCGYQLAPRSASPPVVLSARRGTTAT